MIWCLRVAKLHEFRAELNRAKEDRITISNGTGKSICVVKKDEIIVSPNIHELTGNEAGVIPQWLGDLSAQLQLPVRFLKARLPRATEPAEAVEKTTMPRPRPRHVIWDLMRDEHPASAAIFPGQVALNATSNLEEYDFGDLDSVTVHVAYPLAATLPDAVRTITASLAAAAGHERFEVSVSVPTELVKFEPQILVLLLGAADGMEAALDPGSPETLLVAVGPDGEPDLPSGFSLEHLKAVVLHREANEDLPEAIADSEMTVWQQKLEARLQPPFIRCDVQFARTSGHSGDWPWQALLDRDDEPGWEM